MAMIYKTADDYYQEFVKDILALRKKYYADLDLLNLYKEELRYGIPKDNKEKDKFSYLSKDKEALEDAIKIANLAIDHTTKWKVKDGYEKARKLYSAMIRDSLNPIFRDEWEVLNYGDEDYGSIW